jgi:hypothetical protein
MRFVFRLFISSPVYSRRSSGVQNFCFSFLTILFSFPRFLSLTLGALLVSQRIRNIQNRRDIRAPQGEAVAHDRANHQVLRLNF